MTTERLALRPLVTALLCSLAAGCSYQFSPASNAPGTLTVDVPGSLPQTTNLGSPAMPGGALPPPAGMEPAGPSGQVASLTRPVSGPYRRTGVALNDPGGVCQAQINVYNWTVSGNQVSFGSFNGVIAPEGSLTMQAGPSYISGRFIGSHFTGRFSRPQPSCMYSLTLDPVG